MRANYTIAALLLALSTPVVAAQPSEKAPDDAVLLEILEGARSTPEFIEAVDAIIEPLMEQGPHEPHWEQTGIDIRSTLAALPGGIDANLLYEPSEESSLITILSGAELPLPDGFVTYVLKADLPGDADERGYLSFTPGLWLELSNETRQTGNAICYLGKYNLRLHAAKPLAEWTKDDLGIAMLAYDIAVRMSEIETCLIYYLAADGGYSTRVFSPDGRPYDRMNDEMEISRLVGADRFTAIVAGQE